jgi:dipeptidyl aminopeptidase/acylaminoacyl peptidase
VVAPDDPPVDLTPVAGSRAWILRLLRADPAHVVIGWNARDRRVYDLYRVNVVTGAHTLLAENPGDVIGWAVDRHGRPLARVRHVGPDERVLEVQRDGAWRALQRLELEEFNLALLGPTPDDAGLWMLSGRGRDRRALVRLDLATGDERVVHEDPEVDVEDAVISGLTHRPLVALTYPDRQVIHFLDDALKMDLAPLRGVEGGSLALTSFSDDDQLVTVVVSTEKGSHNYLVDRRTRHTRLLGRSHILKRADALATTEPIAFRARDGVPLRGYLTRPAGSTRPGPLVLHVHGGHWARDYWGYDGAVQFLANRGYAVLQVNYRGSTGYGRAFRELAVRQYAGTMHDDLVDGVRWAVRAGVADPARVAIYGGSYGGYAAMVGMTFTPDVFACGVAFVGISNWLTYYERTPAYWEQAVLPLMHKYVGDPRRPEDRRHLEAISPLFRVQEVKGPMLLMHGAHDARVSVRESRQMAEALERAGKTVRLVVFEDEGHSRQYGNWRNAVRHYQEVEEFLAGCLGGRRTAR